jgi:branched-chain amino acid transport system substrate-binding protein
LRDAIAPIAFARQDRRRPRAVLAAQTVWSSAGRDDKTAGNDTIRSRGGPMMTIAGVRRCAAVLIVAGAAIAGAWIGAAAAAEPIRIGSFLAVSGKASFLGEPEKRTLELYAEKINAEGGVLGRPIQLVVYDTGSSAKDALTFVKRLIDQDKVDVIVGGTTTGETMAVIGEVEAAGVPFISLAGGSEITEPVKKWVFKTPHTDRLAIEKIYADMKRRGIGAIGLLSGSGGFDKSCHAAALALAPASGITIAADETHGAGDTDMTAQLTKIKGAAGVQGFLYCGFGAPTSIVAKNFKQIGLTIPHYQTHGSGSMSFIAGAEGAAEGARLPAAALVVVDQLPADHPQKAVASAYKQAYGARYAEPISTFGGHAYDGLFIAVEAIRRAGGTDKAKVRDEIERTRDFVGVDGIFTMSPADHLGLNPGSFVMVEVAGGTWKLIE